jgi:NAD(P)-dependent dehydrogenase (short-subunit alcohol dehydrogenase family)
MSVLRSGLLDGRSVLLAGEPLVGRLAGALAALGARVVPFEPQLDQNGEGGADWVREQGGFHALVHDASVAFGEGGAARLAGALDDVWISTAAVANGALIPAAEGGKIVLIAPRREAGELAGGAAAALENLARTLSIEWARFGITVTAIARGDATDDAQLATLVAFLVSAAGDYYSGCRFELV